MKKNLLFFTTCLFLVSFNLKSFGLETPSLPPPCGYGFLLFDCSDENMDGFEVFDLDEALNQGLLCHADPADFNVTYFLNQADAEANVYAIPNHSAYSNISNPQTIYARAEPLNGDPTSIIEFEIEVFDQPAGNPVPDLITCESDFDGFTEFYLNNQNSLIHEGNWCSIVTYHESLTDAENATNSIDGSAPYLNISNPQTIYYREENSETGNSVTGSFYIQVNNIPDVLEPTPLDVCDEDNDGVATFDLTIKDPEITAGISDFSVSYFETNADAMSNTAEINPSNSYQNSTNPQTLYVRVDDSFSGCVAFTTLTIRVNPLPDPSSFSVLETCDDDNDGFAMFDLTNVEPQINPSGELYSYSFHLSLDDAQNGINAISEPTMFTNSISSQIVYVKVDIDTIGCFSIIEIQLVVNPLPIISLESSYSICEGESILLDSGVDPGEYSFFWSTGEPTPTIIVSQTGTYTLTAMNLNSGCLSVASILVSMIDCTDSDDDGVNDADEDENENGNLDDDDTDNDNIPNYLDSDDDGDNVDTSIEINIVAEKITSAHHAFVDTDNDLIENYLDDDDDGDNVLTINEDYNNNGDPTDDDINMNGVPDYLDMAVTLDVEDFNELEFKIYPNPANDEVNVSFFNMSNELVAISIIDIQGKLLIGEEKTINNSIINLDVNGLGSGIYFMVIDLKSIKEIRKLIIN